MKKIIIFICIILLSIITCSNCVSAENETLMEAEEEIPQNDIKQKTSSKEVLSTENGNYNITFNNGYNGYCINYGEHEAGINDTFTIKNTSEIINKESGESVGNYLKVFFVEFNDIAMKDKVVTQHIIWHFTDNFNNWRIDPNLINEIKLKASETTIPDNGASININSTTQAIFEFIMLDSTRLNHQNFFGYKINYKTITNESENNTQKNQTDNNTKSENQSINVFSVNKTGSSEKNMNTNNIKFNEKSERINLKKHKTGNEIPIILLAILFVIGITTVKFKKREK